MVTVGDFSRVVSAVHAAAIAPDHWVGAMAEIRKLFGANSGAMIMADDTSRVIEGASLPPAAQQSYADHYRHLDYVLEAVERGPVGLIRSGADLIALNPGSEFNSDWMRPHQMQDGVFVRLTGGERPTSLVVAAPRGDEAFATSERIEFVSALVPHLQQALQMQAHLEGLSYEAQDVAVAVDGIRHGAIVVGPGSAVVHLNRAAEDMTASGDGPRVRAGRLVLSVPSADAALQRAMVGALGCGDPPTHCADSLPCPRSDGLRPYVIHVLPFTPTTRSGQRPRALVMIIDPERLSEPPRELLHRLFGLTNAEAEVALRVARGQGLTPIADDMSLSMATVKTHLQRTFLKTETHRQAELVRLLMAITP